MKDIGIIIPALNEAGRIRRVITGIPRADLEGQGYRVRIAIVDGHSTDGTLEIASCLGVEVLRQTGHGKGQAVREAFAKIQGDYIFVVDGDDTYPAWLIPHMLGPLTDGVEVVIGRRQRVGEDRADWLQYVGNKVLTGSANLLFGTDMHDLCSGMWGFQGHVPRNLDLTANGFDIEAEMFVRCVQMGYRVGEVEIPYRPRGQGSKLRPVRDGVRIFRRLLQEALRA